MTLVHCHLANEQLLNDHGNEENVGTFGSRCISFTFIFLVNEERTGSECNLSGLPALDSTEFWKYPKGASLQFDSND